MSNAPDLDTLLNVSEHEHRRIVLAVLATQQQSLSIDDLTNAILKYNHHLPRAEVDDETINRIRTDLGHVHLPRMAEAGVIHYDPDRNIAELTAQAGQEDSRSSAILAMEPEMVLDQLELERDLRRQRDELKQQNERLDEFASIVSHDLRSPLQVAQGRLELAREEYDTEHLDAIARAHERIEALIENLLTLAREGEGASDVEPTRLDDCSEDCWRNVDTAEAALIIDADRRIKADQNQLQELLENLYRNAIEHGGHDVTVTVGTVYDGFYVEDDGPGIPEDNRTEVFESGYSTKEKGTGFGLSIVRQIVEAHGWEIRVTDGSEGGARFEITGVQFTAE